MPLMKPSRTTGNAGAYPDRGRTLRYECLFRKVDLQFLVTVVLHAGFTRAVVRLSLLTLHQMRVKVMKLTLKNKSFLLVARGVEATIAADG